jgi:hypothetical protein
MNDDALNHAGLRKSGNGTLAAPLDCLRGGLSVIPIRTDGGKAPALREVTRAGKRAARCEVHAAGRPVRKRRASHTRMPGGVQGQ